MWSDNSFTRTLYPVPRLPFSDSAPVTNRRRQHTSSTQSYAAAPLGHLRKHRTHFGVFVFQPQRSRFSVSITQSNIHIDITIHPIQTMAPRAFSKLFSSRSSTRSNGSDRRSSLESIDSGDSYVISLPSYSQAIALTEQPARVLAVGPHPQPAEMLDDDNLAWGRPSRKQHSKTQYWGRS